MLEDLCFPTLGEAAVLLGSLMVHLIVQEEEAGYGLWKDAHCRGLQIGIPPHLSCPVLCRKSGVLKELKLEGFCCEGPP